MQRTWLTLVLALVLATPGPALAAEAARVVVVHSYNPEYVWTRNIDGGIREALRGLKVDISHLYLDAKRQPDPEEQRRRGEHFRSQIEALAPQVVIAVDDPAQQHLVAPFLKGRTTPQVIFCGVNAPLSLYGFPAPNVSGVRERWHFREGFALLKKIAPRLRSVAVLVEDSESGGFVLADLREEQRKGGAFALELASVEKISTFQQWQRRVLALQERADALALGLYHNLRDEATGRTVDPETVSEWNNRHVRKPTLGFTDFAKSHGHLCGVLESGHEQGHLAGQMARLVLERGAKAGSLPVRLNQQGIVLVNLKTAERIGLAIPFEIIAAAGVVVQ